jgi:anion-transporting  ArsA/GET3 family ATPase
MTGLKKFLPFGSPSTKKQTPSSPEQSAPRNGTDVQPVDVIDIDPEKLMNRLKLKFGSEFEIHVGKLLKYDKVGVR